MAAACMLVLAVWICICMRVRIHTSIFNLRITWLMGLVSAIRVSAFMDIKLTFLTRFRKSNIRMTKSRIEQSALTVTCKSMFLSSGVGFEAFVIWTLSLSFEESPPPSLLPSFFRLIWASKAWFLWVSSKIWAFKELKYSLVPLRTDALSFCKTRNRNLCWELKN